MIRNWIISLMVLGSSALAFGETLTISYIERKPYYFTENGQPAGTLLERVRAAAADAKIAHEFVPMAIPRIMNEVKSKTKAHCSVGWYRTPERVQFAQFSEPFARDEAFAILTRKDLASQVDAYPTLAALFANKNLTLGVASGFSYGEALDRMIREQKPKLVDTEPEHGKLITMLAKSRFSYMFVIPVELDSMLAGAHLKPVDFHTRNMSDMPAGATRYLMCSPGVSKATMDGLNSSIKKLFPGF
jgi:polar amino acid transport system substrate-binding protein